MRRFTQANTIIPGAGNSSAWDRYAYTLNNPLRYTDPSGHYACGDGDNDCDSNPGNFLGGGGTGSVGIGSAYSREEELENLLPTTYTISSYNSGANQQQTGGDDCGPTSIAIAACLYDPQNCGLTGDQVETWMEFMLMKPNFFGVPTKPFGAPMQVAITNYLPGANVTYANGTSLTDLRVALAGDNIVIVAVSWQTDAEIRAAGFDATVGHYMVATGYKSDKFSFMDPGQGMTVDQINDWVQTKWLDTSNSFISSGSMWIISTP